VETLEPDGLSVLSLEREGHIATLWLDRPEKRNAMGAALFEELPRAMEVLGSDRAVRAVVLAARGPAFSVGLDLTTLDDIAGPADDQRERHSDAYRASRTLATIRRLQASISSVADCPKPVIAAVHGWCIGGAVDLITACDIRLASQDAVFSVRETRMAMVADMGSLQRLPLLMPMGRVAELVYTGKDIDAAAAERIGLVNALHEDQSVVLAAARAMATEIAANSPFAVQGAKAVMRQSYAGQVAAGLSYVAAWNAGQLRSNDLTEAVTAFFEKRDPHFSGD
jgi:enoyl-CoA hydratase